MDEIAEQAGILFRRYKNEQQMHERYSTSFIMRECNLEPQGYVMSCLPEGSKLKRLTTPTVSENVKQQSFHALLVLM